MEEAYKNKRSLDQIARDYFDYLGCHLPQQCANDEFYFLPRSEAAIQHLNRLDALSAGEIQDHLGYVKDLLREIPAATLDDLEEDIDRHLLKQSMESFIREFEEAEVWREDPTLYVKIPLVATDQVISQTDRAAEELRASILNIFAQIPPFLAQGLRNLCSPSEIFLQVALDMTQDAIHFYKHDVRAYIERKMGGNKELSAQNKNVLQAWEGYKRDLLQARPRKSFAIGEDGLRKILAISLSYPKSPNEIIEIVQCAYRGTQEKIRALAREIDSSKTWNRIIYEKSPRISSQAELMGLYEDEIGQLRRFFSSQAAVPFPPKERLTLVQTPSYLRSLRATASYRAPLTGDTKGHGIFYITPGKEDLKLIAAHCPYLSAHETYPGHHILDHHRIHHSNPIRRQIESPLFYEGWACYAERLLDELGYISDPHKRLIGLKRQLWRMLRAILDVKLHTGRITLKQAATRIVNIGYSSKRARRQVRRFALTPGYQLCYFMGVHGILELRQRFASTGGLKTFHDIFLTGGQLPFYLVERRLEANVVELKQG